MTTNGQNVGGIEILPGDQIDAYDYSGSSYAWRVRTEAVYRDFSAWMHIVYVFDTTQSTPSNRVCIYVNGVKVESLANNTYPAQDYLSQYINTGNIHYINQYGANLPGYYSDLYMADVFFLDGTTPGTATDDANGSVTGIPNAKYLTDFGEFDTTTGVWNPKAYTGSYGTNGFHLDFADNSSDAALGDDTSGNNNDWSVNNFSVTDVNYSSQVTGTNIDTNYGRDNTANMFDGSTSTAFGAQTITFSPSPSLVGVNTVEVYLPNNNTSQTITVNGTYSRVISSSSGGGWWSVTTVPSNTTVTSIVISGSAPPDSPLCAGVRINGSILYLANENDSLRDSPTNGNTDDDTGLGGEVAGNYCTWNPLNTNSNNTLSNGNLDATGVVTGSSYNVGSTFGLSSGKWYWEITAGRGSGTNNGGWEWGIAKAPFDPSSTTRLTASAYGWGVNGNDGGVYSNNSSLVSSYISGTSGAVIANGDTVMVAYDADNGKLWLGKNGTWGNNGGTGDPAAGTNAGVSSLTGTFFPVVTIGSDSGTPSATANFGQRAFVYQAPSGFKALCTANLPTPTIADGSAYMDVVTYEGTAPTSKTISGLEFSPDFVWIKNRTDSTAGEHRLYDRLRGALKSLYSNLNNQEATEAGSLTAFTSDGFTVGDRNYTNGSTDDMVAWTWDAGGEPTTDNVAGAGNVPTAGSVKIDGANMTTTLAGSIPATRLSANTTAKFSIVTWPMQSSGNSTIAHGLGVAPDFWMIKNRTGGVGNWGVYHSAVMDNDKFLNLNTSSSLSTYTDIWGPSLPDQNVFGINTAAIVASSNAVGYFFAAVEGYSAFGSYTGSTANPPFIWTGFKPKMIIFKNVSAGSNWRIYDTARDTYNLVDLRLVPDEAWEEAVDTNNTLDILSNGFKLVGSGGTINGNNEEHIYCAWAENPFKYARAR